MFQARPYGGILRNRLRAGASALAPVASLISSVCMAQAPVLFEDVSNRIDFEVVSAQAGGNSQTGAAWFDFDNDGDLDLFLANGCGRNNGLFENDGTGMFTNVAAQAGVQGGVGANGVVAADIDNDGFKDIFLTGEGGYLGTCVTPATLYHNDGTGSFTDITAVSGIVGPTEAFSAAFGDINNDGFLDLFITGNGQQSGDGPPNKLFLNNGDLTFTDISVSAGVDTDLGACAAFFSDFDRDGFTDLFVADCVPFATGGPIELFRNNHDLTFTDVAPQAGLAKMGYWMGLAPGDFDNDGDIDFFVTNLGSAFSAFHALYRNNGDQTYTDIGAETGVAGQAFSWGATMTDFDNDGFADIYHAGNCPPTFIGVIGNPGRLLFNDRAGAFNDMTATLPVDLTNRDASGVAAGDFDGDGFPDILVTTDAFGGNPGNPVLLRNLGNENRSVTFRLEGTVSNRDGVGARILVTSGDLIQTKEIYAGSSFLSMDSPWPTFGLGTKDVADQVLVQWPSGTVDRFVNIPAGTFATLVEGAGVPCTEDAHCDDGNGCVTGTCTAGVCIREEIAGCTTCRIADQPAFDSITLGGESLESVKNRFLSFRTQDAPTRAQAIRVTFLDLPAPFDVWNGASLWVDTPRLVSENGSKVAPIAGTSSFNAAMLTCEGPVFMHWTPLGVVHVFHEGIIPGGTYEIRVVDFDCPPTADQRFSRRLEFVQSRWGDVVTDCVTNPCSPPQPNGGPSAVGIIDIVAVLDKFGSRATAVGKARADLEGPGGCLDLKINITDVTRGLDAFSSVPYPFAPSAPDPCNSVCTFPN